MVFEKIKGIIGKNKDPLKGLEKFTPQQQETILQTLQNKEAEILQKKAELELGKRLSQMESRSGVFNEGESSGSGIKDKLASIREFRRKNLERRQSRMSTFNNNNKLFREGKLSVKPVGPTPRDPTKTQKLAVKPMGQVGRPIPQRQGPVRQTFRSSNDKLSVKSIKLKSPSNPLR